MRQQFLPCLQMRFAATAWVCSQNVNRVEKFCERPNNQTNKSFHSSKTDLIPKQDTVLNCRHFEAKSRNLVFLSGLKCKIARWRQIV